MPVSGWRVEFEATPQKPGWTSVPWLRALSWVCGESGWKAVTRGHLGRGSWAWGNEAENTRAVLKAQLAFVLRAAATDRGAGRPGLRKGPGRPGDGQEGFGKCCLPR